MGEINLEGVKVGARNSAKDQERIQGIHDYAVDNGAVCATEGKHIAEEIERNHLKTISSTDDELRVGNYIVMFGGRDVSGLGYIGSKTPLYKNPDGSHGEYFSKSVDLESDYTAIGRLPVDWEHGLVPDEAKKDDVLGYVDWKTAKYDERGVFVERVLNRRKKYVQWLEELIKDGLIGTSSEAVGGSVKTLKNGEIVKWALKRDTLTVMPAEPRMMKENTLNAYKALGLLKENTSEQDDNSQVETERAAQDKREAEAIPEKNNQPNGGNTKGVKMELTEERLQELLTQASADGAKKAIEATEPVKTAGVQVTVTHDEADEEFKNIAEQCKAVKSFYTSMGREYDPRLKRLQYKAVQGASEGAPADGGILLEPTIAAGIVQNIHEVGPFSADIRMLPVSSNSNSGWVNGVDETSRATGSRWGGIRGYRLAEGDALTKSKPTFRRIQWELKKYGVLVYGTDELLQDTSQFTAIVNTAAREELAFMVNDDIYNGLGVAGAQGIMQTGALISVTRTDANAILGADISALWQRLSPASKAKSKWYVHTECAPQLDKLFAVGSTAVLFPYAGYQPNGVRTLYGRPIVETEFNAALGTTGDIMLADMTSYLGWQKGDVQYATSIHVEFLTDQEVMRFVYRFDGKSAYASPLSNYKGSGSTSPFVTLTTAS